MQKNSVQYTLVGAVVIALIALSSCGGAPTPSSAAPYAAAATSAPAMPTTAAAAAPTAAGRSAAPAPAAAATSAPQASAGGAPANAAPIDRKIIKNAQLSIVVENVDTAVMRLTGIASDVGGYLVGSRTFVEGNRKGGQVTLSVPVDNFEPSLNLVRKVALTIENDVATSSDVTEQFVDLQSRLINLQATEARIREFLVKAQTVDEALKVNAQLSDISRQIEEIKGKLNAMNARTAYSTITVDMRELVPTPTPTATPTVTPTPTATPTATPNVWHPDQTLTTAVTAQTNILRQLGDALIWFGVILLPYLLVALLVFVVIRRLVRK
ncbi:MAG: DUF4349 domain-containing protein [Chloroflexi bacterium]|nr:DUF4349 domain-containing protein [Chloroflexota bacterium]